MIDTHAHIYLSQFNSDLSKMLDRTFESGVSKIFMPNIDSTSIDDMLEVENKYSDHCYAMMGLHPCSVNKNFEKELYIVEEWLDKRKFCGVGEIGLDLYWDKTFFEQQKEAFKIQAEFAKKHKIPLIIHTRDSMAETIELLEQIQNEDLTGIVHCFTGNAEDAKRIIKTGFLLGIGGVVTFKNGGLDKVLPEIDLEHLVLETDSPYLAPVPYRGKRNECSYIPIIAQKIADIKNINIEKVSNITTKNALKLFNQKIQ